MAMIEGALRRAIVAAAGPSFADTDPQVRRSARADLGDFQSNCVMGLAKALHAKPQELARRIVDAAGLDDIAERVEVAGPGFINIRLRSDALARMVQAMDHPDLGVPRTAGGTMVVDMCAVNVAKQMHVGHLRSTIIGDALARTCERLGWTVRRENHLGDWGLPIAMVLHELRRSGARLNNPRLDDLDRAYRAAQLAARDDQRGLDLARALGAGPHRLIELEEQNRSAEAEAEGARATLVRLQQGQNDLVRDWHALVECTLQALDRALQVLGVRLSREHNRGESFFRDRLTDVVDALVRQGVAREDQGALVVPFPDRDRPMLIRKSDGGFLYATTDMAAIRFRVRELGADRIIYVVDARQRDHFRDLFDAARLAGWDRRDGHAVELVHVAFGAVLGSDRRPLKTRSGENITLQSLLEEAVERGTAEVTRRAADPAAPTFGLDPRELAAIGRAVGIGAVKYADLCNDLVRDYLFDFERLISFEGNTGPYLQYAHARICSIFARGGVEPASIADAPIHLAEPAEKDLALHLLCYGSVVADVGRSLEPHRLCGYLYDLAMAFSAFYESCPVARAEAPSVRRSRLRLCDIARRVLADGLDLLGLEAPRRM
jgi:arginyl-tRNA synthetase